MEAFQAGGSVLERNSLWRDLRDFSVCRPFTSGMGNLDGGGGHIMYVLATRGPQTHLEHTHTHKFHVCNY